MSLPNQEQIRRWNDATGQAWVDYQDRLDALMAPMGKRLVTAIAPRPGERILEIGCGTGHNTIELAKRVRPGGLVVGLDVSTPMLQAARRRDRSGLNVQWIQGDAQTEDLGDRLFDAIVSRFGVMFFDDPIAAFRSFRRSLEPEGRLVFLCWQAPHRNPWAAGPIAVVG
ncbi:MAG: class I SAM-dependent methyltransferase, partial [Thermoanaerobaculia bacterium]|nr:class I SAM-dependent methyltransferase [Thermoanaerobaculia bacterium]